MLDGPNHAYRIFQITLTWPLWRGQPGTGHPCPFSHAPEEYAWGAGLHITSMQGATNNKGPSCQSLNLPSPIATAFQSLQHGSSHVHTYCTPTHGQGLQENAADHVHSEEWRASYTPDRLRGDRWARSARQRAFAHSLLCPAQRRGPGGRSSALKEMQLNEH